TLDLDGILFDQALRTLNLLSKHRCVGHSERPPLRATRERRVYARSPLGARRPAGLASRGGELVDGLAGQEGRPIRERRRRGIGSAVVPTADGRLVEDHEARVLPGWVRQANDTAS